jgi:hypothetical protein
MQSKRTLAHSLRQPLAVSEDGKTFPKVVYVKPSDQMTEYEFCSCLQLIGDGGAVNTDSASDELRKSEWTGIFNIEGKIVGTGTIKRPRPNYAANISRKSRFSFSPDLHELGYVAVDKAHRREKIGETIVEHLLYAFHKPILFIGPNNEPVPKRSLFATTSNEGMKVILERTEFARQGTEWSGVKGDMLSLWILEPK